MHYSQRMAIFQQTLATPANNDCESANKRRMTSDDLKLRLRSTTTWRCRGARRKLVDHTSSHQSSTRASENALRSQPSSCQL